MNLTKCNKPEGVVVSLPLCDCWHDYGTECLLIPVGKSYWYCQQCEQWYKDEDSDALEP